jgi:isopenicillin N synthase-like dioxygenase
MIPIIDLDPLFSDKLNGVNKVAKQIYQVYSTLGFAQIINHQVPPKIIQDLYCASKQFHHLSIENKHALRFGSNLRGYIPIDSSRLKISELGEAKKNNQSESFLLINEIPEDNPWFSSILGGVQVWPTQLPEFKNQILVYFAALKKLSEQLIRVFSVALNLPADYLSQSFSNPNIFLRLLSYPAIPKNADCNLFSSAPHTDYGCITLLHQDNTGGLQILTEDNQWLDVPPKEESFVLNIGQMMTIWSNGKLKSTKHRVLNTSNTRRYSIPFFYNCDLDTVVKPLPTCISKDNPAQFEPVMYGEHLQKILLANYNFL